MSSTYNLSEKDSTQYEDGYAVFLRRSDFRERVLSKFSVLAEAFFTGRALISVLDIGCGDGQMTLRYINELKKLQNSLQLTLVEPAIGSLNEATVLLKPSVDSLISGDAFDRNYYGNYDLIIASYVFYHLQAETLTKLSSHLNSNGALAIMMGTNDHPLKMHPALKFASAHGSSDKLTPFLDSLKESGNFKVSRNRFETKLDLNGLWSENKLNEEGLKLLSFSLNRNLNELEDDSITAINEIFETAFNKDDGFLKPVHEIIWVERLQ